MAIEEGSHASWEDDVLSPFVSSLQLIVNNENSEVSPFMRFLENYEVMDDLHPGEERKHIMDRVPDVLREQNENAYTPTIVSIGPLHRGTTQRLQAMERLKVSYTRSLLNRTRTFKETMRECADAMLKLEKGVRKCYEPSRLQPLQPPNTQKNVRWLAKLMLIDGCFIIELLFRYFKDSIFSLPFKLSVIQRDLLLLENQIPFKVLEELFKLTVKKIPSQSDQLSLHEWVFDFFRSIIGFDSSQKRKIEENPSHILHLLHIYYRPQSNKDRKKHDKIVHMESRIKYSATELRLAGVKLKAVEYRDPLDIKFTTTFSWISCWFLFKNGNFEIPPFDIHEYTESFFRNIIALELSWPWIGSYFTSFAFLMDLLIDTHEDVKLFEEAGIIYNRLGPGDEVARLFNGICNNATASGFHYCNQYKQAMDFCNHSWRVSTIKLRQDYFSNPWTGISVIAAIILFVLTFISTLYTMFSFYH